MPQLERQGVTWYHRQVHCRPGLDTEKKGNWGQSCRKQQTQPDLCCPEGTLPPHEPRGAIPARQHGLPSGLLFPVTSQSPPSSTRTSSEPLKTSENILSLRILLKTMYRLLQGLYNEKQQEEEQQLDWFLNLCMCKIKPLPFSCVERFPFLAKFFYTCCL